MYKQLYDSLVNRGKSRAHAWQPGSGLHRHHIIPEHAEGLDTDSNVTYLTVREHIACHYLLWKMNQDPNDLRSMKMLGAKLTPHQRRVVGIYCRDNMIGFHGANKIQRKEWSDIGRETMRREKIGLYHANTELRSEWNANAGRHSGRSQFKKHQGIHVYDQPELRKQWASLGGKSHTGKKWMTKDGRNMRVDLSQVNAYLTNGWSLGVTTKRTQPTRHWRQREVSIGEISTLLEDHEIEVDSPDGWIPVTGFVDKGPWDEYVLLCDGVAVRCNENHLFQTVDGWQTAKQLMNTETQYVTKNGLRSGIVVKTGNTIPIVDIQVDHPNHRYYTNGVSSHNTNVGKSLIMCHFAAAALLQGYNVLYITLEMADWKIARRIDANLLNIDINELMNVPKDTYMEKVDKLKTKIKTGKLVVHEYPTASASSAHFRALLSELKLKKKFVPDIIFIDYLNIATSARIRPGSNVNSYTYIKAIAEELRGMAVEFSVPIVSATQTTRSGYSSSDLDLGDTSESFGLPATADFMFGATTSEEMEKLGHMQIKQLKNRDNDVTAHKRFIIGIDRTHMRLFDVQDQSGITQEQTPEEIYATVGKKPVDKPLNKFGLREGGAWAEGWKFD